jgi:peptidoglycan/LPS O-acetylase OafA/YrhL
MAAGAGFISNIVLLGEAGYFDNAAETKPLLHLWSLGIEEQFYIVWPLLLWFAWRRKFNLLTMTIFFTIISFVLNFKGSDKTPSQLSIRHKHVFGNCYVAVFWHG